MLDRPREAAGYLAALVLASPDSAIWPDYTLRLAELYLDELADSERATILLRALVEHAPQTEAAARARELLD
jgi:TolA-binding protein